MGSEHIKALTSESLARTLSKAGAIKMAQINDSRMQKGGRVSASGGAGPERQEHADHINKPANRREWPSHGVMRGSNRKQRTGIQGGVQGSNGNPGNHYTGGPTNRRG